MTPNIFAERRRALGLSRQEVADLAGVAVSTVAAYETGGLPRTAARLLAALGLGIAVQDERPPTLTDLVWWAGPNWCTVREHEAVVYTPRYAVLFTPLDDGLFAEALGYPFPEEPKRAEIRNRADFDAFMGGLS